MSGFGRSGNPIPRITFPDFHSAMLHSDAETTKKVLLSLKLRQDAEDSRQEMTGRPNKRLAKCILG